MLSKYNNAACWMMKYDVPHTTHYKSLIDLCTTFDESGKVSTWLQQKGDNATYKSEATSREMFQAIGQIIDENVVKSLALSPVLALMTDEAIDVRNRAELSVCIRYLNTTGCSIESFIEMAPLSDTKAETITDKSFRYSRVGVLICQK